MRFRVIVFFITLLVISCKEPFSPPNTSTNSHYLVIEGVISVNDSTFIRLSRTKNVDTLRTIIPENNAQVTIESDANNSYPLTQIGSGIYATPPLNLDVSQKYRLRIRTADSKEYISDFVPVKNSPPIDSVGYSVQSPGVQLYVNTHDGTNATRYYRWDYTEDWQFHSMYASAYYSNGVDSILARTTQQQVYNCYGNDVSGNVLIASTSKLVNDQVYQAPLTFIPATSEKIEKKYSILVKQYALTSDAYDFWNNLKNNTEKLGSIFDALPSELESNYHCVTNPSELVIGYLSVGNVTSKRIYLTKDELLPGYGPEYPVACELDTAYENPQRQGQRTIGILIPPTSPYMPVSGLFIPPDNPFGGPNAFSYSTKICVDCTLRGKTTPPSYWK